MSSICGHGARQYLDGRTHVLRLRCRLSNGIGPDELNIAALVNAWRQSAFAK